MFHILVNSMHTSCLCTTGTRHHGFLAVILQTLKTLAAFQDSVP
jgi:hypothetical protein